MIGSILIATDGSDTARRAVERGGELGKRLGASVHVVTAYQPLRRTTVKGGGPEAWQLRSDSRADAVLEEATAALRLTGVEATQHARADNPVDAILDTAEKIGSDLIVLGNKGLSVAGRRMLGNVPNRISHHASCSVLIVHTT